MNSDDLQKELDGLWSRVTSGMPEAPGMSAPSLGMPASFEEPSITSEVSMETFEWMKNRHRGRLDDFRRLVDAKELALRELRERLASSEQELTALRRRAQRDDSVVYQKTFDLSVQLEQAQKAFKAQEARFDEERSTLRAMAEQAHARLAAEAGRFRELERQFNEREQQYLLDLQELRSSTERAERSCGGQQEQSRKDAADLKQAKGVVEKTLSELLQERHDREAAETARAEAVKRLGEAEDRLQRMENVWQEERKQWQELWDRERSTWEAQRQEFTSWEERLRKERETWHTQLQDVESRETRYATQMAEALRKSSEAGERIASWMRDASSRFMPASAPAAASAALAPAVEVVRAPARPWRAIIAGVLIAGVLAGAWFPVMRWRRLLSVKPISSMILSSTTPTAMAYDGSLLWVCDWNGEFLLLDPADPSRVIERFKVRPEGSYHPSALALSGDGMYSLDSAQSRIVRHALGKPSDIRYVWPTPGPAPTALAHDGKNLWSYDAVTRVFYRHLGEGADSATEDYHSDRELVPGAMAWHNGELWVYDAKTRELLVLRLEGKIFVQSKNAPFTSALQSLSFVFAPVENGRSNLELWALAAPAPGEQSSSLKRFLLR
jgi:hypothetical protein